MDDAFTNVLRVIVVATFVGFFLFALYKEFSFSYHTPDRRYQYRRRFNDETEFEVRGSGFCLNPTMKAVAMIPRYVDEPVRQVYDCKRQVVVYDNKRD
jgi:anaerobic C4-dicarboxylate transporter